jgi:hypothetical protein
MIKYQLKWGLKVFLNVTDSDTIAPIEFDGNQEWANIVKADLIKSYGAFGHILGTSCTAPDLAAAMINPSMQVYEPKLIEGESLTVAVANIPDGAFT